MRLGPFLLLLLARHASCAVPPLRKADRPAADSAAVDLTMFETQVLPRWLKNFQVTNYAGEPVDGAFRQKVGGPQAPYGTADVIHLLSTVNQLNFSEAKRDAWAAVMQLYQNKTIICNSPLSYKGMKPCPLLPINSSWSGFYTLEGSEGGWEPWHSSGDITASFHLLGRYPKDANPMYLLIAANRSLWEPTFAPLVYGGIHKIIGILGTLLMQRPEAAATLAPFLSWFVEYIDAHEQASTGFLCDSSHGQPQCSCRDPGCVAPKCAADRLHKCVAPTFATNMIKHVGLGAGWHLNRTAQRTILDLQLPSGFWSSPSKVSAATTKPGYHDIDSLFIAVRTLPWNPDRREEVQAACAAFLRALASFGADGDGTGAGLNDEELVLRMYTNTHDLAAPVYAASICQEEFPALLRTVRPWHFSGDRAPFI